MPEHGNEDSILVARVDDDSADLLSVAEAEVTPGLARIGRFVDAVTGREVGPLNTFARPDVDHVRIRRGDGKIADRSCRLLVKDWCPHVPGIRGLPHTAVVHPDVKHVRLTSNSGSADRAPAAEGSDHAPLETLSLIHISEPTRLGMISYAVFC